MRTCPTSRASRCRRPGADARRPRLRLEVLEERDVPAILIQIDYSYDNGFFTSNPTARALIERAATELGNSLTANLAAVTPSGGNTWSETFFNPANGAQVTIANPSVGANTIKVYVGGRPIPGDEAGGGGPGGYSLSGSADWINTVQTRNHVGFSTWGGSIAFDTTEPWFFGQTTAGLNASLTDFYSVATHELGHVLGIGTSSQWTSLSSGGYFRGANAMAAYGGAVPLGPDGDHWADGLTVGGQRAALDPILPRGTRVTWTALDAATLRDLGWNSTATTTPPATGTPPGATAVPAATVGNPQTVAFTGGADGALVLYRSSGGALVATGQRFNPFPGYGGELRVAGGDFDGDGVTDYAVTTGAGPQATVAILSGVDGHYILGPTVLFPGYSGGLYVAAADIDRDGKAELVIAAGINAPPLVATYRVVGGGVQVQSMFMAFGAPGWQGGIRIAAGDLNRDGYADVVVTTASQCAAIAVYSGFGLSQGSAYLLYPLSFPAPGLAVGLNVAVGDVDGDGYADLAVSLERGPGSGAVVAMWSGAMMAANPSLPLSSIPMSALFFALPADDGGGRLAIRDIDGDGKADLVVVSGSANARYARAFTFAQLSAGGAGGAYALPLGSVPAPNGIYVG